MGVAVVEVGVCGKQAVLHVGGKLGQASEVVVAVAFGMGDAEGGEDGEVLRECDRAGVSEVFAAEEVRPAGGGGAAEMFEEAEVGEGFEDALAVLMRGAGVSEGEGRWQAVEVGVRLVNNGRGQAAEKSPAEGRREGDVPVEGLLDED